MSSIVFIYQVAEKWLRKDGKVILFGAGKSCINFIDTLQYLLYLFDRKENLLKKIECIVDNEKHKIEKVLRGIPIYMPEILVEYRHVVLITTEDYYSDIAEQLDGMGYKKAIDYIDSRCFFAAVLSILKQENIPYVDFYEMNRKRMFFEFEKRKEIESSFRLYKKPDENQIRQIKKEFNRAKIPTQEYFVDIEKYENFKRDFNFGEQYYLYWGKDVQTEKILEHFVAWDLLDLKQNEIYVDVAASESPFVRMLREKEYQSFAIDLEVSTKFSDLSYYMKMDATQTKFPAHSIDAVSLQCAYEMFLKENDTKFIKELARILSKDGRCVILPLYMHTHYCGYSSPDYIFQTEYHDSDAILYYTKDFGIPYARQYSVNVLKERVLDFIIASGLKYKIYTIENNKEINVNSYLDFLIYIYIN